MEICSLDFFCVLVTFHGLRICLFSRLNSFLPLDRKVSLGRRERLPLESGRGKSWLISYVAISRFLNRSGPQFSPLRVGKLTPKPTVWLGN